MNSPDSPSRLDIYSACPENVQLYIIIILFKFLARQCFFKAIIIIATYRVLVGQAPTVVDFKDEMELKKIINKYI